MKKIAYISMLAGLMLTGCIAGDYGIKPADPQAWEQEEPVVLPGTIQAEGVEAIDLAEVEGDSVAIAKYTPVELTEGEADLTISLQDGKYQIPVQEDMKVAVAELQDMVVKEFGKKPVSREFTAELLLNVMVEGQASLIKSQEFTVQLAPEAPFIDSGYYIIGDMNGWNGEQTKAGFKFQHSEKDVYDDPVFTIIVDAKKEDGTYWKIIPEKNFAEGADVWQAGVLGTAENGDEALEGTLVVENPQAGKIAKPGKYLITLNMIEYTYKIEEIIVASEYYLVGTVSGWNADKTNQKHILYPQGDNIFTYTTKWVGDHNFKLWAGENAGEWNLAYGTAKDGDESPEGTLVQNAGAIKTPTADEFYTVTFDMAAKTYKSVKLENQTPTEYEFIALAGDFNSWSDTDMTMVAPHNWRIAGLEIKAAGGIKFKANHEWKISWGNKKGFDLGMNSYGKADGTENMNIPAGTYDVYFNDITLDFVFIQK